MKKSSVILFQIVIILIAAAAAAFLLIEPWKEGVNVGQSWRGIYFDDPFLVYAYIASIPFFTALYQAFRILSRIGRGDISAKLVSSLRTIKYCGYIMMAFVVGGMLFIFQDVSDDRTGGIFMGGLVMLLSIAIATMAAKLEKKLAA